MQTEAFSTSQTDRTLETALHWLDLGLPVALATVLNTWGSSPRPVGSHMAINTEAQFAGSVSGGCIEAAVILAGLEVIAEGSPRTVQFEVTDDYAWSVGLSCGGRIEVGIEPIVPHDQGLLMLMAATSGRRCVARISDYGAHRHAVIDEQTYTGELSLNETELELVRERMFNDWSGVLTTTAGSVFMRTYSPPTRIYLVGGVHIAQLLAPMARLAGLDVVVIDPRDAFLTTERFPQTQLAIDWPDAVFADQPLDRNCAVVTLAHQERIDDPALLAALEANCFYIGALGSRATHQSRLQRLEAAGAEAPAERLYAPVGIPGCGRSPGEIATAILAELLQARMQVRGG